MVDYFAVVGTSVGGGEDVVGYDNCHTWVGKCYKNDEECLEVDFCMLNMILNFVSFSSNLTPTVLPATTK